MTQNETRNSSRLSLALIDLPLTPFGMKSPASVAKNNLQHGHKNKLSRLNSNFKKQVPNSLSPGNIERVNFDLLVNQKNINTRRRYKANKFCQNEVINKNDDNLMEIINNEPLYQNVQLRRDSLFTDIDDGSFIEFTENSENQIDTSKQTSSLLPHIYGKKLPQFYYTCNGNNETKFSTSSKIPLTPVGFHKFVNTLKDKHTENKIVEETFTSLAEEFKPQKLIFDLDESVIAGSKDIIFLSKFKDNLHQVMNSTQNIKNNQNHPNLPDISSLTLNNSSNCENAKESTISNQKNKDYKFVECIILSESENEDLYMVNSRGSFAENIITESKSKNKKYMVEDSSLISEDISIISSIPKQNCQKNIQNIKYQQNINFPRNNNLKSCSRDILSPKKKSLDNIDQNIDKEVSKESSLMTSDMSSNKENQHLIIDQFYEKFNKLNEVKGNEFNAQKTNKETSIHKVDERVVEWVLNSPFKDGSFGTSFFENDDNVQEESFVKHRGLSQSLELKLSDEGSLGKDSGKTVFTLERVAKKYKSNNIFNELNESSEYLNHQKNNNSCKYLKTTSHQDKGLITPINSNCLERISNKYTASTESSEEQILRVSDNNNKQILGLKTQSLTKTYDKQCNLSSLKLMSDEEYPSFSEPLCISSPDSTPIKKFNVEKLFINSSKPDELKEKQFAASNSNYDKKMAINSKINLYNNICISKPKNKISPKHIIYDSDSFSDSLPDLDIKKSSRNSKFNYLGLNQANHKDFTDSVSKQKDLIHRVQEKVESKDIIKDSSFSKSNTINIKKGNTQTNKNNFELFCSSSSEDNFEIYINSLKKKKIKNKKHSEGEHDIIDFVVSDSDDIECYSISPSPAKQNVIKTQVTENTWRKPHKVISSSSESDEESAKIFKPRRVVKSKMPKTKFSEKVNTENLYKTPSTTLSFLSSLTADIPLNKAHLDAIPFLKNFKKRKAELTEYLYDYFNIHVFERKLPKSMNINWNARMTKTAGYCYYQLDKSKPSGRGSRIELSTKVIDEPGRLRDTLVHELCHSASWIISGYKDGHGPLWKSWASKAMKVFPELPVISRCHSYEIKCKYTYRCKNCGYSIGRHSKSLDTEKKVCGYCYSKFELLVNYAGKNSGQQIKSSDFLKRNQAQTPRTPNSFALFVKENYGSIKRSETNLKHKDVMKSLSEEFTKMKTQI